MVISLQNWIREICFINRYAILGRELFLLSVRFFLFLTLTCSIIIGSSLSSVNSTPQVQVVDNHTSHLKGSYYYVYGEVKNADTVNIRFVQLEATFYDSSGSVIHEESTYTRAPKIIAPGDRATFWFMISEDEGAKQIDSYTLSIIDFQEWDEDPLHVLTLASHSYEITDLGYMFELDITGEVKNNGSYPAKMVYAYITCYNRDGNVVYYEDDLLPSNLLEGRVEAFEVEIDDEEPTNQIHRYELLLEGEEYSQRQILPLIYTSEKITQEITPPFPPVLEELLDTSIIELTVTDITPTKAIQTITEQRESRPSQLTIEETQFISKSIKQRSTLESTLWYLVPIPIVIVSATVFLLRQKKMSKRLGTQVKRKCPQCSEEVRPEFTICPHCGEILESNLEKAS